MAESIKSYVVDASFVVAFFLPDEKNEYTTEVFMEFGLDKVELMSTFLLPFEVLNTLKVASSRNRINHDDLISKTQDFLDLGIEYKDVNYLDVLRISLDSRLSFYDSSYLSLSLSLGLPLLTLDKDLMKLLPKD